MIFEKKVIIGSIASFLATVIGIIAIFFPDLFNLQKEKVQNFSASISTKQEAQKLVDFLDKMTKEKGIFKLDVLICFKIDNKNNTEYSKLQDYLIAQDDGYTKQTIVEAITPLTGITSDEFEMCFDERGHYNGYHCGSKQYLFPTNEFENTEWITDFSRMSYTGQNSCDNTKDTHIGLAITGYFMNTKSRETICFCNNISIRM